jgi:hypothetical protein
MTTKAKKTSQPVRMLRKNSKLALSKRTLSDLTPSKRQGGAVVGGVARTQSCHC